MGEGREVDLEVLGFLESLGGGNSTAERCYRAHSRSSVLQGLPFGGVPTVLALNLVLWMVGTARTQTCTHTHAHVNTYADTRTHTHTHIHTHTSYIYTYTHTHACLHALKHLSACTHRNVHAFRDTHTNILIYMRLHSHTHAHTNNQGLTLSYAQTYIFINVLKVKSVIGKHLAGAAKGCARVQRC